MELRFDYEQARKENPRLKVARKNYLFTYECKNGDRQCMILTLPSKMVICVKRDLLFG